MKFSRDPDEAHLRAPYRDHGVVEPPTPYDLPVKEGAGSSSSRPPKRPSFRSAFAHFFAAAGQMTKRVTAVLAVVSSALTVGSVAFAYWVSAWAKDFVQNNIAAINAEVREIRASADSIKRTVEEIQRHDQLQDDLGYQHTTQIARIEGSLMSKRPYKGGVVP